MFPYLEATCIATTTRASPGEQNKVVLSGLHVPLAVQILLKGIYSVRLDNLVWDKRLGRREAIPTGVPRS